MLHAAIVPVWLRIAAAGLSNLDIAGASRDAVDYSGIKARVYSKFPGHTLLLFHIITLSTLGLSLFSFPLLLLLP